MDSLFSSLCLGISIECACCIGIMLISLNVILIFMVGSLSFVSMFFIDRMCVVALAHATKSMSGATFHPLVVMLLMSGWYVVVFLAKGSIANMSLQYVFL